MVITARRLDMSDLSSNAMQRGAGIRLMTREGMIGGVTVTTGTVTDHMTIMVAGGLRILRLTLVIAMAWQLVSGIANEARLFGRIKMTTTRTPITDTRDPSATRVCTKANIAMLFAGATKTAIINAEAPQVC
jgi:hypothetical protein